VLTEALAVPHHAENVSPPAIKSPKNAQPSGELKPAALVALEGEEQ
jgi:hypothetical protein